MPDPLKAFFVSDKTSLGKDRATTKKERRDALHFIEHDDSIGRERPQLQPEQCGVGRKRLISALVEQVDDLGIGEGLKGPRALTNAAHAIQEEASPGRGENPSVSAHCHHVVIIPCKMTA